MLLSFLHSGYAIGEPKALLDNDPLRELLTDYVRFRHIDEAIASGELQAVSVTAMSYTTGESVTFFQGSDHLQPWERSRRVGVRTRLNIDHLMASSAIPTLFPACKIEDAFYGDGALRQLKPISPALQLGASRVFVIGVSDNAGNGDRRAHVQQRVHRFHGERPGDPAHHQLPDRENDAGATPQQRPGGAQGRRRIVDFTLPANR
jgi:predicted acylesterase/phospholipase RssA